MVSDAAPAQERWTEKELLERIRDGDRAAAEELVRRTYAGVYAALARLCGDRDRAADLTQETFRRAWRSLGSFDGRSAVASWLYRIAYNAFLNDTRTARRGRVVALDDAGMALVPDGDVPPDARLVEDEDARRLRRAVLALEDDLRVAVTARYWSEQPTTEIARAAAVSEVTVRKRIRRALEILRQALAEEAR